MGSLGSSVIEVLNNCDKYFKAKNIGQNYKYFCCTASNKLPPRCEVTALLKADTRSRLAAVINYCFVAVARKGGTGAGARHCAGRRAGPELEGRM